MFVGAMPIIFPEAGSCDNKFRVCFPSVGKREPRMLYLKALWSLPDLSSEEILTVQSLKKNIAHY